jgi:hypothetical protein
MYFYLFVEVNHSHYCSKLKCCTIALNIKLIFDSQKKANKLLLLMFNKVIFKSESGLVYVQWLIPDVSHTHDNDISIILVIIVTTVTAQATIPAAYRCATRCASSQIIISFFHKHSTLEVTSYNIAMCMNSLIIDYKHIQWFTKIWLKYFRPIFQIYYIHSGFKTFPHH